MIKIHCTLLQILIDSGEGEMENIKLGGQKDRKDQVIILGGKNDQSIMYKTMYFVFGGELSKGILR